MNLFENIPQDKPRLRREMRARLAGMSPDEWAERSCRIIECLTAADGWVKGATVVSLFGGLMTEPDLLPLVPWLRERGSQAAFFAVDEDGSMRPHRVRGMQDLIRGPFGVLMPDVSRCPLVNEADLSVVLVPGLAFSVRDGARLGRGKGYYDRSLGRLKPGARAIGVGFSMQMIESVPREPHDVCMQSLVSEDGWRAVPPAPWGSTDD